LRGEPMELFRTGASGKPVRRIDLSAEFLLDRSVVDAYGKVHQLKGTRLRYEVGIERRETESRGLERLYVSHEEAYFIRRSSDPLFARVSTRNRHNLLAWAPATNKKPELITTQGAGKSASIEVRQDGVQGRLRTIPLNEASATFLSTVRTADEFPHLFALREELVALRFLQLGPSTGRLPSDMLAPEDLQSDGSNLAAVLARIKAETGTADCPNGALAEIRQDLAALIPGVLDLDVVLNEVARQRQLFVTMRDQARFSSRVLSDGTLRILALLTLLHDPKRRGVLCFEEPENGIHEARVKGLIELLRDFCTDLNEPPQQGEKLSQILVNSHSPEVMSHLLPNEIVAADMVLVSDPATQQTYRRSRMRSGVLDELPIDRRLDESRLTRFELGQLLRREVGQDS
jgi:predicted ATPase